MEFQVGSLETCSQWECCRQYIAGFPYLDFIDI